MRISSKCSIAVHCLLYTHEYGEVRKVTSRLLALSCGCNSVSIRGIVSALRKGGIVTVKCGTGGIKLCRPPEEITLYRICTCVEPDALEKLMGIHPNPLPLCPVGRRVRSVLDASYEKIRSDMKESLQSVSLRDILDAYHRAAEHAPEE